MFAALLRALGSRPIAITAAVFLLFACTAIRDDELECEEAVSHLMQCCGFTPSTTYCTYVAPSGGCDSSPPIYPALDPTESECIRSESCGDLASSGVCKRAAAARPGSRDGTGVCP
jgi:hypothetical protein